MDTPTVTMINTLDHNNYSNTTLHATGSNLNIPETNYLRQGADIPYAVHFVLGLFMIPVTAVAVGGNALVIWLFIRFQSLRTPANMLVVNLSLSDLLMAGFGYPLFIASSFNGTWLFGVTGCDFYGMTGAWFALMSINSMVAIAVDRYLIIHMEYKITNKQSVIWIAAIWIYSLIWALPPMLGWSRYNTEAFGTTCSYDYLIPNRNDRYFLLCVVIGDFVLPLIIICYCYIWIWMKFRAHKQMFGDILMRSRKEDPGSELTSQKASTSSNPDDIIESKPCISGELKDKSGVWNKMRIIEYKIARTVVFVVAVFSISWTPYAVVTLIGQYGGEHLLPDSAAMVPVIIAKLAAVYNPFIYALTHPRFRQAIKKTFPCCFQGASSNNVRHGRGDPRPRVRKNDFAQQMYG